jgi:hypothetical protein
MGFLADRKILITGVLSNRSIAYGVARASREGAALAFTYVNEDLKDRVTKLASEFGSCPVLPCDVAHDGQIDALFDTLKREWGVLDGLLHSIAFAPREALAGDFLNAITREAFGIAHDISSYSLAALAKGARPLMQGRPGSIVTLTYLGAVRSVPNYNVMGSRRRASRRTFAPRVVPRSGGPPRERHLGGAHQDARRSGHRQLLEAAFAFRGEGAPAPRHHDRRSGQRRRFPVLRPRERDHGRDRLRRRRLFDRRGRGRRGELTARARAVASPPIRMTSRVFDAVLIGGGHNGLVCAAYLAAKGRSVCVVERRGVVGGAAVTEEFHPGFRNSTASYTVSLLIRR